MDYVSLRKQYPVFHYRRLELRYGLGSLSLSYDFEIPGLSAFSPCWDFPLRRSLTETERERVRSLAFSLGMAELISYWKPVCSPEVHVHTQHLDDTQVGWWQNLFYHGLGEFYHVNGIPRRRDEMPSIICKADSLAPLPEDSTPFHGAIVPIGGGKDSLVTLSHIPGQENDCFFINPKPSAQAGAALAGYGEPRCLIAERRLDKRLLDLNRRGFLNGHTPFSALLAFASVLCAYLNGHEYVVLSNEQSANEATASDGANHQYSKSFAFEQDFCRYLQAYHTERVKYFSFLRPVSELQIAALFAAQPQYHSVFRSCNKGSREDKWCGTCSKCLFVAIILSPFLSPPELEAIFAANIWENRALTNDFDALTGAIETKPFECVGSREEVNAALHLCLQRHYRGIEAPYLLEKYRTSGQCKPDWDAAAAFRDFYCPEHRLPTEYDKALRNALKECKGL